MLFQMDVQWEQTKRVWAMPSDRAYTPGIRYKARTGLGAKDKARGSIRARDRVLPAPKTRPYGTPSPSPVPTNNP